MNWYDQTCFIFLTAGLSESIASVFGGGLMHWNSERFWGDVVEIENGYGTWNGFHCGEGKVPRA